MSSKVEKTVPPRNIAQKMHDSGTVYRLEASQLAQLQEQSVAEVVLNYMQQTYLDAVRADQRRADYDDWEMSNGGYYGSRGGREA